MKRLTIICIMAVAAWTCVSAQTSLAGRVYHHPNIMAEEFDKEAGSLDEEIAKAKKEAIANAEKKKGRKLTAEEKAKLDKESNERAKEAKAMVDAMKKGVTTAVTIEFKDATNMVMKADMKVSEEALKKAGVGWLKRKALKAALAVAPSSQKGTYTVKGSNVYIDDGKDKDTLTLSSDGKYLYGKMDDKTKFKLTRTK